MIDDAANLRGEGRVVRRSWIERSLPPEADDFPGPGARVRSRVSMRELRELSRQRLRPFADGQMTVEQMRQGVEPAPAALNFRDMSFEGYWFCHKHGLGCMHVQEQRKGEKCVRCGREMKWIEPIPR